MTDDDPIRRGDAPITPEGFADLIGELGREVFWLLDDGEDTGDPDTITVTRSGFEKVSAVLDKIEALPIEIPGVHLGAGAKLQEAFKALPAVQPVVKVKPLVWEAVGREFWARDCFGDNYEVKQSGECWAVSHPRLYSDTGYPSQEVAQSAAQADYEARILAALDVQPAPDVAALVEALRGLIHHAHECERELTEELHHTDFCGESLPLTKARAAIAAWDGRK